jgi:hypothetical protein
VVPYSRPTTKGQLWVITVMTPRASAGLMDAPQQGCRTGPIVDDLLAIFIGKH